VTACGSPCYAAPEMIAGKKYFGPLADLWSIGVILFALVSGYLPFEDPNTSVLYKKILSGDYTCPKWLSPEVKDLIHCILEVDPKKRYTVENVRRHPWYNLVPESAIPRDVMVSTDASRNEILTTMSKAGVDPQAVLGTYTRHALELLYHFLTSRCALI
jgi:5'-AMP-activated protein kinase catalytic alpha subunit